MNSNPFVRQLDRMLLVFGVFALVGAEAAVRRSASVETQWVMILVAAVCLTTYLFVPRIVKRDSVKNSSNE